MVLTERFGPVPAPVLQALEGADRETLRGWLRRAVHAPTLSDIGILTAGERCPARPFPAASSWESSAAPTAASASYGARITQTSATAIQWRRFRGCSPRGKNSRRAHERGEAHGERVGHRIGQLHEGLARHVDPSRARRQRLRGRHRLEFTDRPVEVQLRRPAELEAGRHRRPQQGELPSIKETAPLPRPRGDDELRLVS